MVLQQYVDGQDTGAPSLAQLNAELAMGKAGADRSKDVTPSTSVLARSVKAARRLAEQNKAFPVGTVLLARGGEVLGEVESEGVALVPRDGQVLDPLSYPALKHISISTQDSSDPAVPAAVSSASAEPAVEEGIGNLNIGDVKLGGALSSSPADALELVPEATVPSPDFVSAYQRHWARAPSRYVHLVVLQHGFLGQAYDMHLIENAMRLDFPGTVEVSSAFPLRACASSLSAD
jgi:hypothetical protein